DHYHELLRVSRQWWLLKLLKWASFGHQQDSQKPGSLVLFCPTCPQPSINVYPDATNDLSNWKYNRTLIMDGNFKAEHLHDRQTDRQVWLMDGLGFMSPCNNHRAVNQANSSHAQLEATGIGATHLVVDFQKWERCAFAKFFRVLFLC
ncbi:hypothetical protein PAXRUDRAFT_171604, partial [Paxillus rubicundulus Ve08.2h10]